MVRTVSADGEITESLVASTEDSDEDNDESNPTSRRSSNASESAFEARDTGLDVAGEDRPRHITVFTDTVEGEPEIETEVSQYDDTLPDGTVVKRKVYYLFDVIRIIMI